MYNPMAIFLGNTRQFRNGFHEFFESWIGIALEKCHKISRKQLYLSLSFCTHSCKVQIIIFQTQSPCMGHTILWVLRIGSLSLIPQKFEFHEGGGAILFAPDLPLTVLSPALIVGRRRQEVGKRGRSEILGRPEKVGRGVRTFGDTD